MGKHHTRLPIRQCQLFDAFLVVIAAIRTDRSTEVTFYHGSFTLGPATDVRVSGIPKLNSEAAAARAMTRLELP